MEDYYVSDGGELSLITKHRYLYTYLVLSHEVGLQVAATLLSFLSFKFEYYPYYLVRALVQENKLITTQDDIEANYVFTKNSDFLLFMNSGYQAQCYLFYAMPIDAEVHFVFVSSSLEEYRRLSYQCTESAEYEKGEHVAYHECVGSTTGYRQSRIDRTLFYQRIRQLITSFKEMCTNFIQ